MALKKISLIIFILFLFNNKLIAQETRWIDDIVPNEVLDGTSFKLCNNENQVIQYFFGSNGGVEYNGGKSAINSLFFSQFKEVKNIKESGLIRIRFIVNCEGKIGRFRLLSSDLNYQPFTFTNIISDQLLKITKDMNGWLPKKYKNKPADYYQYLIFKIEEGKLIEILP